jgi:hypothetical protein
VAPRYLGFFFSFLILQILPTLPIVRQVDSVTSSSVPSCIFNGSLSINAMERAISGSFCQERKISYRTKLLKSFISTKLNPLSFSDFWNRHIDFERAISYCFTAEGHIAFSGWSTAPWASQHVSTHVATHGKYPKIHLNYF